jgi:integrase
MRRNSKVYKKCVIDHRCRNERCGHPWYCQYWKNGVRYRRAIPEAFAAVGANPKTKTEAETVWLPKFVTEVNEAVNQDRKPFVEVTKVIDTDTLTVRDFIDKHYLPRYYQAETIADIKSPDGRSKVKLLRRDLGDLRLKQLESEVVVDDYKKRLQATGIGVPGYNRRLSKLRQILNWAKDWKFISSVPFSRNLVSLDVELEIARERRLGPGEEEKLLRAADPEMKLRLIAALDTGMREGEMLRVQLKRIDFKHGFIHLPRRVLVKDVYRQNTKNDKTRRIPITPRLVKLLKKRRFIGLEGYVFGDAAGALVEDIKKPWNTVNLVAHGCKLEWTAGGNLSDKCWEDLRKTNLHWHDLRHEALSRLGESGELSDHELMEIAGHANLTTTQRYLNTRIERLKQGVLRAAAKATGLVVTGRPGRRPNSWHLRKLISSQAEGRAKKHSSPTASLLAVPD